MIYLSLCRTIFTLYNMSIFVNSDIKYTWFLSRCLKITVKNGFPYFQTQESSVKIQQRFDNNINLQYTSICNSF